MVAHWRRSGAGLRSLPMWVNGIGALATGAALIVILAAKFVEGAWITVIAIPALLMFFKLVHRHYARVTAQVRAQGPLDLANNNPPVVLLPTSGWDKLTAKALRFSMWLSTDVIAVHLSNLSGEDAEEETHRVCRDWARDVEAPAKRHGVPTPKLVVVQSPYRSFLNPLLDEIEKLKQQHPNRLIGVVVTDVIETRWWQLLLHRRKPARLRASLLKRGDHRVIVINVPWYIEE
jgi:hypothetical protein